MFSPCGKLLSVKAIFGQVLMTRSALIHQEEDTPGTGTEETETNGLVNAKLAEGGEIRAYLIQAKRLASERSSGLPDRWKQY